MLVAQVKWGTVSGMRTKVFVSLDRQKLVQAALQWLKTEVYPEIELSRMEKMEKDFAQIETESEWQGRPPAARFGAGVWIEEVEVL